MILIFDPFAGSGTLGRSAVNLNRYFFLAEKEVKYIHRIKENLIRNLHLLNKNKQETKSKFVDIKSFITLTKTKI